MATELELLHRHRKRRCKYGRRKDGRCRKTPRRR